MKKIILTLLFLIFLVIILIPLNNLRAQFNIYNTNSSLLKSDQSDRKQTFPNSKDVILTWTTTTFNPLPYKLKTLPTLITSEITVLAIILNKDIKDAIFAWYTNNKFEAELQGKNKSTFTFYPYIRGKNTVRLKIKIPAQSTFYTIEKEIDIPVILPEIIIYKQENPYFKIFKQTLPISTKEKSNLIAIPYYFNINKISDLNFTWKFNGQKITGNNILNLKISKENETEIFTKILEVKAKNLINSLESAFNSISLLIN